MEVINIGKIIEIYSYSLLIFVFLWYGLVYNPYETIYKSRILSNHLDSIGYAVLLSPLMGYASKLPNGIVFFGIFCFSIKVIYDARCSYTYISDLINKTYKLSCVATVEKDLNILDKFFLSIIKLSVPIQKILNFYLSIIVIANPMLLLFGMGGVISDLFKPV